MERPPGIAHGKCWCGCGEKAPIATFTNTARGYIQGEPRRYIVGHIGNVLRTGGEGPNPGGMCMCGCGKPAPIAKYSYADRGWVAGKPIQYHRGHHGRAQCAGYAENEHGCWIWQGALDPNGYGKTKHDGVTIGAHRKVWMDERGEIPEGHHLHHACGNRACVNPDHLEPVTHTENVRRAWSSRTHCKNGHEFSPANTRWRGNGRVCKACQRERQRTRRMAS